MTIPAKDKIAAAGALLITAAVVVIFHNRLGADFWPLDRSTVGPNLIADWPPLLAGLLAGVLIGPAVKRAAHRFVDTKLAVHHARMRVHTADQHDRLHDRLTGLEARHDQQRDLLVKIAHRVGLEDAQ